MDLLDSGGGCGGHGDVDGDGDGDGHGDIFQYELEICWISFISSFETMIH